MTDLASLLPVFIKSVGFGLAVAAPVGPMSILCMRRSLTIGWRHGLATGFGIAAGDGLYAAVAVDPLRTLHLVLGEEVIMVTGQATRTTHDVGVNWAPFPDGTLQIIFAYNEALRALEFGRDRSTLGAVRWNLSRKSFVDVSFQRTRSEFVFQKTASRIFSINVRLFA